MELVDAILFILAYSIGIATVIIQLICYLKKMEYFITIAFIISFMLLIIAVSADELNFTFTGRTSNIIYETIIITMLLLALTTPLNIHTERIVKFAPVANRVFYIITSVLLICKILSYFIGYKYFINGTIKTYMFLSVGYSMIIILVTKPGMLIRHRDKIEKITSIVFFSIFPFFIVVDIFYDKLEFIHPYIPEGSYILFVFFIYLSSMKLLDDIKRLTLFSQDNSINQHVLSRYGITPRESEVLSYIVKGKSYNEISDFLFISLPTVKTHISRAYKKMNINNKIELINLINQN